MKRILSLFTDHPASVQETYLEHLVRATSFSLRLLGAGICCFIHGLLPFLFVRTGSTAVTELHDRMVTNRQRRPGATTPGTARGTGVVGAN